MLMSSKRNNLSGSGSGEFEYDQAYSMSAESDTYDTYYYTDGHVEQRNRYDNRKLSPKRSFSHYFTGVPSAEACRSLLPLMLALERQQSKTCFEAKVTAFYRWKKTSLHIVNGMDLSDNLEILRKLADSHLISDEELNQIHDVKISHAIDVICTGLHKIHQKTRVVRPNFHNTLFQHWKKLMKTLHHIEKILPMALRVFSLTDYEILWGVFCSYCTDKRMIPTDSKPVPENIVKSPPTLKSRNSFSGSSVRSQSASRAIQSPTTPVKDYVAIATGDELGTFIPQKYRKRILSSEQVWVFFKDCKVCPVFISKRQLDNYIMDLNDNPSLGPDPKHYFHETIANVRRYYTASSPPYSPSKRASSTTRYRRQPLDSPETSRNPFGGIPSSPTSNTSMTANPMKIRAFQSSSSEVSAVTTTVNSVESKPDPTTPVKTPMKSPSALKTKPILLSFNSFLRLCWKIIGDSLVMQPTVDNIQLLRKYIESIDRASKKHAILITSLDEWNFFIAKLRK